MYFYCIIVGYQEVEKDKIDKEYMLLRNKIDILRIQ